jgi:exonuclease VII large subunit
VAAPEPPAAEPVDAVSTMSEPVPAAAAATATAVAVDAFAALSTEDADLHRKAQRFARLLVDEIKLYNQAKVAEGRKNKDLYDRLKEDIDKSQATYQKRFGATIAASAEYFNQELVRSLAEDDSSVMGANFQR